MLQVVSILFGAAFTLATALALGLLLVRALRLKLYRQERYVFALAVGAACLSLGMFLLAALRLLWPGVFAALGAGAIAGAVLTGAWRPQGEALAKPSRGWRVIFWCLFALFTILYFFNALAPETSPDGSQYHLGLVSRYLGAHGFLRIPTSMYAQLSQGGELLYAFAFAFGRHSAAAMVHFGFLAGLPFAVMFYGRRFGFTTAGVMAALLVYLSPIVGYTGTTAYIDILAVGVVFVLFYVLQVWDQERQAGLLVVAGLLAGFAYAIKYTAGVAVPYAVLFVLWKSFRKRQGFVKPVLIVGLFAAVMIAPWMVKNWLFVGNPVAPFYNRWFPNPALQAGFEQSYREILENWGGVKNKLEIPLEVTVGGSRLQGLIGPAFLLAPIALFASRYRAGRQALLAAGVFLLTYPSNIGTRFLIPALPFVALGMGMTLANWKPMAPLVIALHALTCWPWMMETYCGQYAMRIERIPVAAALRLEPEEHYLDRRMSNYAIARMLDEKVPPEATVLAYDGPPTAYHSRKVLVSYEGSLNHNLCDMLWAVRITEWQPKRRLTFRFPGQPLRRVRVVQTAKGSTDYWSISEFHALLGGKELPREAEWRLRARPNPWEVQMAFDGDPMTRWRSWQPISAGDYVELDFGRTNKVDAVVLDTTPDQWAVRLRLDGQPDGGAWRTLSGEPEAAIVAPPSPLRRTLSRELRWQGIEYVLIMDSDFIAADVAAHLAEWGWTQVDARNGAHLYHVE